MTGDTKAGSAAVSSMIAAVKKTIARHDMIRPGDTVVAAVSGGPDSVCLLHLLHGLREELPMGLVVAHFDHGLRPAEDGHETRFVESLARSLDCAFDTARADPELRRTAACLEERARHARYRFLEEVRIRHAARRIALGHTRDDQAETVLMRLMRGSGPTGLAGIPPTRDGVIIRPLIDTSRQDVERYLDAAGLSFVTDSSNRETRHLRNRIRMELLPELARYQPRIVERLAQTADIMRMDDRFMEKTAQEWMETHTTGGASGDITCAVPSLRGLPDALRYRVIRRAIAAVGGSLRRIGARHLDAVMEAISGEKPQSAVDLPGSLVFRRTYGTATIGRGRGDLMPRYRYVLDGPGRFPLRIPGYTVTVEELDRCLLPESGWSTRTAFLDLDLISFPLVIRNFLPGDRFVPLGMHGRRKLKDFFIDNKIPAAARSRIPVLTHRDAVVWVGGFRIDDRFKVTPRTERILKVSLLDHRMDETL